MSIFEAPTPAARRTKLSLAAIGLIAVGGIAGGEISHELRPAIEMAPMHVVPIRDLATAQGIVTIRGRIAERFGDRWVIDDGTGRTLIDGGPHDEGDTFAPLGAIVSVQGRLDRGAFHPSFLVDATGTVTQVGPPPSHHDRRDGRHPGDDDMGGPDQGPPTPTPKAPQPAPAN